MARRAHDQRGHGRRQRGRSVGGVGRERGVQISRSSASALGWRLDAVSCPACGERIESSDDRLVVQRLLAPTAGGTSTRRQRVARPRRQRARRAAPRGTRSTQSGQRRDGGRGCDETRYRAVGRSARNGSESRRSPVAIRRLPIGRGTGATSSRQEPGRLARVAHHDRRRRSDRCCSPSTRALQTVEIRLGCGTSSSNGSAVAR